MEEVEDPPRRRRATDDDDDSILAPGIAVRLQYSLYLFVGLLATMIMRGMMGAALSKMQFLETACAYVPVGSLRDACASDVMSYRVSFTLAVFFFIHWMTVSDLTCCVKSRARAELQEGFFYVKTILVVLLFLCTFALPTSFFIGYAYLCLFASAIFLLINVLFLVDFSYQWSDDWGERSDRNVKWVWYLLAVAIASFVGGIVLNGVGFYLFVPHWNCNLNAFALVFVLLGAVLYVTLSIFVPHGSIVPSSIVFIYTSFLLCSTLRMESDARCNRLASYAGSPNSIWQVLLASVVSSFTLGYAVVSSGGSGAALNVGVDEDGEAEDPDESGHLSHYMFFYFIMMMGSMYLAMLSTGWKISGADEHTLLGSVNIAFWVRSTTVCVAIVLYIWSLVAPYTCCQGRDFGFATEEDDWWD